MSSLQTIETPQDYVNYTFNLSARGITEVGAELAGLSNTVSNLMGLMAFKTSEYLTHTESLAIGVGVAATAAFASATKNALKFEQAVANVQAIGGEGVNANIIGERAMEYSNKFGMNVDSMTMGLEALARAGLTATNIMSSVLEEGVKLSKLEGIDLEDSINDLISTTNLLAETQYDINTQEYADAVKAMNQHIVSTSESAPINAQNIMQTLQHVGGYASANKIDQEDLFAVIAQLGAKGTKGEMAGTALRAFIAAGQKDQAQRALARIGLKPTDLWTDNGEAMLSVSEMKDVIDEALEARGYSKQEKLEFYSDFAGYKQANQIMKIDTSEVQNYKETIANAWDLGKKLDTILGTVNSNLQIIYQTSKNFMTKVGRSLLPILNAVLIPIRLGVELLNKIPLADKFVGLGLGFLGFKSILLLINQVVPALATMFSSLDKKEEKVKGIAGYVRNIKDDIKEAANTLKMVKEGDREGLTKQRLKYENAGGLDEELLHKMTVMALVPEVKLMSREEQGAVFNKSVLWRDEDKYKEAYEKIAKHQNDILDKIYKELRQKTSEDVQQNVHVFFNPKEEPKSNRDRNREERASSSGTRTESQGERETRREEAANNAVFDNLTSLNQIDIANAIMETKDRLADAIGRAVAQNINVRYRKITESLGDYQVNSVRQGSIVKELQEIEKKANVNLGDIGHWYGDDIEKMSADLAQAERNLQNLINSFSNVNLAHMNWNQVQVTKKILSREPMTEEGKMRSTQQNSVDVRGVLETGRWNNPGDNSSLGIHQDQIEYMESKIGISDRSGTRTERLNRVHEKFQEKSAEEQAALFDEIMNKTQEIWTNYLNSLDEMNIPSSFAKKHLTDERAQYIGRKLGLGDYSRTRGSADKLLQYFQEHNDEEKLSKAAVILAQLMQGDTSNIFNAKEVETLEHQMRTILQLKKAIIKASGDEIPLDADNEPIFKSLRSSSRKMSRRNLSKFISNYDVMANPDVAFNQERLEDFLNNGLIFVNNQEQIGELGSTNGEAISVSISDILDESIKGKQKYGDILFGTVIHELAHTTLQHKQRMHLTDSPYAIKDFKIAGQAGGYSQHLLQEYEAMVVEDTISKMFGLDNAHKTDLIEIEDELHKHGIDTSFNFEVAEKMALSMVDNIDNIIDKVNGIESMQLDKIHANAAGSWENTKNKIISTIKTAPSNIVEQTQSALDEIETEAKSLEVFKKYIKVRNKILFEIWRETQRVEARHPEITKEDFPFLTHPLYPLLLSGTRYLNSLEKDSRLYEEDLFDEEGRYIVVPRKDRRRKKVGPYNFSWKTGEVVHWRDIQTQKQLQDGHKFQRAKATAERLGIDYDGGYAISADAISIIRDEKRLEDVRDEIIKEKMVLFSQRHYADMIEGIMAKSRSYILDEYDPKDYEFDDDDYDISGYPIDREKVTVHNLKPIFSALSGGATRLQAVAELINAQNEVLNSMDIEDTEYFSNFIFPFGTDIANMQRFGNLNEVGIRNLRHLTGHGNIEDDFLDEWDDEFFAADDFLTAFHYWQKEALKSDTSTTTNPPRWQNFNFDYISQNLSLEDLNEELFILMKKDFEERYIDFIKDASAGANRLIAGNRATTRPISVFRAGRYDSRFSGFGMFDSLVSTSFDEQVAVNFFIAAVNELMEKGIYDVTRSVMKIDVPVGTKGVIAHSNLLTEEADLWTREKELTLQQYQPHLRIGRNGNDVHMVLLTQDQINYINDELSSLNTDLKTILTDPIFRSERKYSPVNRIFDSNITALDANSDTIREIRENFDVDEYPKITPDEFKLQLEIEQEDAQIDLKIADLEAFDKANQSYVYKLPRIGTFTEWAGYDVSNFERYGRNLGTLNYPDFQMMWYYGGNELDPYDEELEALFPEHALMEFSSALDNLGNIFNDMYWEDVYDMMDTIYAFDIMQKSEDMYRDFLSFISDCIFDLMNAGTGLVNNARLYRKESINHLPLTTKGLGEYLGTTSSSFVKEVADDFHKEGPVSVIFGPRDMKGLYASNKTVFQTSDDAKRIMEWQREWMIASGQGVIQVPVPEDEPGVDMAMLGLTPDEMELVTREARDILYDKGVEFKSKRKYGETSQSTLDDFKTPLQKFLETFIEEKAYVSGAYGPHIRAQAKALREIAWTEEQIAAYDAWVSGDSYEISQHQLGDSWYRKREISGLHITYEEAADIIMGMILQSPGLLENMILWHGGVPIDTVDENGIGVLNTLKSSSYLKQIGDRFKRHDPDRRFLYQIFAPETIPGLIPAGVGAHGFRTEQEYTLQHGQPFIQLWYDEIEQEAGILLFTMQMIEQISELFGISVESIEDSLFKLTGILQSRLTEEEDEDVIFHSKRKNKNEKQSRLDDFIPQYGENLTIDPTWQYWHDKKKRADAFWGEQQAIEDEHIKESYWKNRKTRSNDFWAKTIQESYWEDRKGRSDTFWSEIEEIETQHAKHMENMAFNQNMFNAASMFGRFEEDYDQNKDKYKRQFERKRKGRDWAYKIAEASDELSKNILKNIKSRLKQTNDWVDAHFLNKYKDESFDVWGETADEIEYYIKPLEYFNDVLRALSDNVTILTPVVFALGQILKPMQFTIEALRTAETFLMATRIASGKATEDLADKERYRRAKQWAERMKEYIPEDSILWEIMEQIGEYMSRGLVAVKKVIKRVIVFIADFFVPIAAILTAITVIVSTLIISEKRHAEALKDAIKNQEEAASAVRASYATYKNLHDARVNETDAMKRQQLARKESIALYNLEADRIKNLNAINKKSELRGDSLWGEYGLRASLQKMGLGFIAGGDFESQYENYEGSTGNIRRIKEDALGNLGATSNQKAVSKWYDNHKMQLGQIEAFAPQLQELYDKESALIEKYGSIEEARSSEEFAKAVQEFADATGLNRETAEKYLDYLQTEQNVENARKVMEAEVRAITAKADAEAMKAIYGDSAGMGDLSNIQDAMVYATADQIFKDAMHEMWWKELMEWLTAIYDVLTFQWFDAAKHAKAAGAYQKGMKELTENQKNIVKDGFDAANADERGDYGNEQYEIDYGDTLFGGAYAAMEAEPEYAGVATKSAQTPHTVINDGFNAANASMAPPYDKQVQQYSLVEGRRISHSKLDILLNRFQHRVDFATRDKTQDEILQVNRQIYQNTNKIVKGYDVNQWYASGHNNGDNSAWGRTKAALWYDKGFGLPPGVDPNDPAVQEELSRRRKETATRTGAHATGGGLFQYLFGRHGRPIGAKGAAKNAAKVLRHILDPETYDMPFKETLSKVFGKNGDDVIDVSGHVVDDITKVASKHTDDILKLGSRGVRNGSKNAAKNAGKSAAKQGTKSGSKQLVKTGTKGAEKAGAKGVGKAATKGAEKAGVKGTSKAAAKTMSKYLPIVGPAVTAAFAIADHNPFEKHYNEDGSEKRAFQATGEVVGEVAGSVIAAGLGELATLAAVETGPFAPIIGALVETGASMILEPVGEAVGGTIGWLADEAYNGIVGWIFGSGEEEQQQQVNPSDISNQVDSGTFDSFQQSFNSNGTFNNMSSDINVEQSPSSQQQPIIVNIENIYINTDDDPEKIKDAFMDLMVELSDQVTPRTVSRTIGKGNNSETTTNQPNTTANTNDFHGSYN